MKVHLRLYLESINTDALYGLIEAGCLRRDGDVFTYDSIGDSEAVVIAGYMIQLISTLGGNVQAHSVPHG